MKKSVLRILIYTVLFLTTVSSVFAQSNIKLRNEIISKEKDPMLDTNVETLKSHTIEMYKNSIFEVNEVSLYGAGGIHAAATSTERPTGESPVKGSLGISFAAGDKQFYNIFFSINGVESIDIMTLEQLGTALRSPSNNGNSLNISGAIGNFRFDKFGIMFDFNLSDSRWKIDSSTSAEISPLLGKVGIYIKPFSFEALDNPVNLYFRANYTYRGFLGDMTNNRSERIDFGDVDYLLRAYHGLEFAFYLGINSVELFVEIPINFTDVTIPGFTGAQVEFGINISGDFIKLK